MKNFKNQENAITLVSLVITIIILLILATISIQLLINMGLFKKAQEAKNAMGNVEIEQTFMLNAYEEIVNSYSDGIGVKTNKVKEIKLNKTVITLTEGTTETIIANIIPNDVSNKQIIWTSSEEDVATVTDGVITAISEGTSIITATAHDGSEKSATCTVKVEKSILTLYDNGNECVDITGGWEKASLNSWNYSNWANPYTIDVSYGNTSRELNKESDGLLMKLTYQTSGVHYLVSGTYSTENMIDLTRYSKLYIQYDCSLSKSTTEAYSYTFFDFCKNKFYIQNNDQFSKRKLLIDKGNITEFDISDISGVYYLQNRVFIYGDGTNKVNYKIKKIWLK